MQKDSRFEKMSPVEIARLCAQEIVKKSSTTTPLLVALTGDSGSGKSYYGNLIRQELDVKGISYRYIDHDSFLISRLKREPMKNEFYTDGEFVGKSKWEILENMFRLDVYTHVIEALKASQAVSYFPYHRESGTIDSVSVTIQPCKIVIFDTSMMLEKMDMIIEIDVDLETIIERKKHRDLDLRTPEQIEEMHRRVQGYYWQRGKPKNPDIVIDNNDLNEPKIMIKNS